MDYVTFGQVITDDVCFPGKKPMLNQLGGAVYTASGMRYWSESVGICSGVGRDFEEMHGTWFDRNCIDRRGCKIRAERSCHSVIHYFEDGEREEIPMEGCATIDDMCPQISDMPEDYKGCKGFYFFKDCEEAFWNQILSYIKSFHPVSVWEILGSTACPENFGRIASLLPEVTIFSLNLTEGRRLCNLEHPADIVRKLIDAGARNVLFRMGAEGAIAGNRKGLWHIPAVQVMVKDVTGGGNSSTGGFLAGFCENSGDIEKAGRCAAASASFIIKQFGQPDKIDGTDMALAQKYADALITEKVL